MQIASSMHRASKQRKPLDDEGDEFEHGDMEANARAEDRSDYSVHQFLAHDDGREGSDDSADIGDGYPRTRQTKTNLPSKRIVSKQAQTTNSRRTG